ncbi:MAG TPA: HlyD family efflux transporter periplasmic adaptor subunit [Pirellulales bacterium]|jgi:multidrug resistance efflux pump
MLRKSMFSLLAVVAVGLGALAVVAQDNSPGSPRPNPNEAHIPNCMVFAKHEVQVSAQEAGVLKKLTEFAEEGKMVEVGTNLGQIDDGQAQNKLIVAKAEQAVAEAKAASDVNIRYNKAASGAAEQAFKLSVEATQIAPKSKSAVELKRLELEWQKAFLGIEQATRDRDIDKLTAGAKAAETAAAENDVERRKIVAPIAGEVTKVKPRVGEWLDPGKPVLWIADLQTMWVEGFVKSSEYSLGQVAHKPIRVTAEIGPNHQKEVFDGKIVFVEKDIRGGEFRVRAEVENRRDKTTGEWLLVPGMEPDMTILLGAAKLAADNSTAK